MSKKDYNLGREEALKEELGFLEEMVSDNCKLINECSSGEAEIILSAISVIIASRIVKIKEELGGQE
jgi:hypothetical protein